MLVSSKAILTNMALIYKKRFEIFFGTLLLVLFESLFISEMIFEEFLLSIFYILNVCAGMLLAKEYPKLLCILLFLLTASVTSELITPYCIDPKLTPQIQVICYLLFYSIVAFLIVTQEWHATKIDRSVIIGLMAGYTSLGMVAFSIFMSIEYFYPGSIQGISSEAGISKEGTILYFSFITLLTVGYGEILPVTPIAQKACILVGLMGQFYLVILTAIIVGKYLQGNNNVEQ
ncbi:potassium channel family protein [Endozoicomonas arenosclerae]|uniref:potassium channel family protein n=1 Tax=Endozoicomonas arenosclerae TaxID=1633495 RepID=UPI000781B5F1|nr:potassium channel family protein [Endozoicomonas arenosclerae]